MATARSVIGDAPKRREDSRFVTGRGRYLDDLAFEGLTHAVALRSPHAHAIIRAVDAVAARAAPGVLALLTAEDVHAAGAPEISPEVPDNLCFDWRTGDSGAVAAAFAAAAHVVELDLENHRIVTSPMEPRGVIGLWDAERGRYKAYVSSQSIHATRDNTARALGVPPSAVRFVAPDVGGGFGAKNFIYPEHVLILWAAKRVGRPVKWIATRSEGFLSDHQARDHRAEAALALDATGRFLALRVNSTANAGYKGQSTGDTGTDKFSLNAAFRFISDFDCNFGLFLIDGHLCSFVPSTKRNAYWCARSLPVADFLRHAVIEQTKAMSETRVNLLLDRQHELTQVGEIVMEKLLCPACKTFGMAAVRTFDADNG